MKLKDIKVGEEYAVGTRSHARKMLVLEVGVHGTVYDGFSSYKSERTDYVRVTDGGPYSERVVPCRQVLKPWDEYAHDDLAKKRARNAEAARAKRLELSAPEMYDILDTLENDAGAIPAALWERIVAVRARVRTRQEAERQ